MKEIISIGCLFLFVLLLSGCARNNIPTETNDKVYVDKDGITNIDIVKNQTLYTEDKNKKDLEDRRQTFYRMNIDLLKRSLYMAAKETIKNNKENFIIVNSDINHLTGFPLNNYTNLKDYCYNFNREVGTIKISCISLDGGHPLALRGNLKILYLSNPSYNVVSINANKLIEEINKEPIQ